MKSTPASPVITPSTRCSGGASVLLPSNAVRITICPGPNAPMPVFQNSDPPGGGGGGGGHGGGGHGGGGGGGGHGAMGHGGQGGGGRSNQGAAFGHAAQGRGTFQGRAVQPGATRFGEGRENERNNYRPFYNNNEGRYYNNEGRNYYYGRPYNYFYYGGKGGPYQYYDGCAASSGCAAASTYDDCVTCVANNGGSADCADAICS